ncbi:MAG: hypothetical protein JNM17_17300 [Archangium sp.]|nr:hypothetical protein [Archangium sp.]
MTTCGHCSAPLKDDLEMCGHCGTVTPFGIAQRQARAAKQEQAQAANQQRSDAEATRLRQVAMREVEQYGKWSVISSLLGIILCCIFPVGPALGIYFGLKARALARERGVPNVGGGAAGTIIGYAGIALAIMTWVGAGVMQVMESKRKEELRMQITKGETLDLKSACALTELELLETRYEGYITGNDFECDGLAEFEVKGKEAVLHGARFTRESKRIELISCLKLSGSSWTVKQLRPDEDCDAPPPEKKKDDDDDGAPRGKKPAKHGG